MRDEDKPGIQVQILYDLEGRMIGKPQLLFSHFSEEELNNKCDWSEEKKQAFAIAAHLGVPIIDHYGNNNVLFWRCRDERAFTSHMEDERYAVLRNIMYIASRSRPPSFDSTMRK